MTLQTIGYGESDLDPREDETFDAADGGDDGDGQDVDADFYDRQVYDRQFVDRQFDDRDIDDLLE